MLWKVDRDELAAFGGELDTAVQMPGWTNVWTMPIQNRVDMLATGVNTPIGIRVLGRNLDDVDPGLGGSGPGCEAAAQARSTSWPTRSAASPISRSASTAPVLPALGVSAGEVNDLIETALAGKVVTTTVEGRERHPVVVRYGRAWREDEESIRNLPVTARGVVHGPGCRAVDRPRSHADPAGRGGRRSRWSKARRRSKAKTGSCGIMSG